jgi:hypothetical protein
MERSPVSRLDATSALAHDFVQQVGAGRRPAFDIHIENIDVPRRYILYDVIVIVCYSML